MTTGCQHSAFLEKIRENPICPIAHLVFADWLAEQGKYAQEEAHRQFVKDLEESPVVIIDRIDKDFIIRMFTGVAQIQCIGPEIGYRYIFGCANPHYYIENWRYEVLRGHEHPLLNSVAV